MNFHLRRTLASGQFFRWRELDGWFYVFHDGRVFRVREPFEVQGLHPSAARRFFALDHDLERIIATFPKDDALRRAIDAGWGLRILRQNPYECLLSFMVSVCSNIPRITRDLDTIARLYGTPVRYRNVVGSCLPAPGTPMSAAVLRRHRLGFRARYLADLNVSPQFLESLRPMSFEDARTALSELPGVGLKVAECVLLFAYERLEAFPVDTWIRRIMTRLYFDDRKVPDHIIARFARDRFGPCAGYAQQFLYAWARATFRNSSLCSRMSTPHRSL